MAEKRSMRLKVRNYHIDSYGHVNNAQYLIFLEEARTVILEEMGYSLGVLNRRGLQVFITEINAKYRLPAKLDDELIIYVWLKEISSRRARWQQEIFQSQSNKLVLTATVDCMFWASSKVVAIPEDIKQALLKLSHIESISAPIQSA